MTNPSTAGADTHPLPPLSILIGSDTPRRKLVDNFLYAPKIKIERARKHLAELDAEIAAYLDSRPARFESSVVETDAGRRFNFILYLRQPDPLLGAIVGDVIHNLRAALDVAVCALVRWKEGVNASVGGIHFPICKDAKHLNSIIRKGALNRLGIAAVDVIGDLKPYPAGNPILCGIHYFDVQDKHAALVVTGANVGGPIIRQWDDDGTINSTLIGDPTAPTELRVVFPTSGPFADAPVVETLRSCIDTVADAIDRFCALPNIHVEQLGQWQQSINQALGVPNIVTVEMSICCGCSPEGLLST